MCSEWRNSFLSFDAWFLKQKFKKGYELDRVNNNGNYCPENCRIVPKYINARNREVCAVKHSKYRYVVWNKKQSKWHVNAPIPNSNGKRKYLGLFDNEDMAYKAIQVFDNSLDGLLE